MLTDEQLYIAKTRVLPNEQDFNFLRSEGLKYIEELASTLWTDYNTHDPGITILETLCYAITELGYRTAFDIKDLLANKGGEIYQDQAFFTAKNILSAAPLTIDDYRKILVDIKGVKNAWLYPFRDENHDPVNEPPQEVDLYAHCKKDKLTYTPTEHFIDLKGLFSVVLDLEETDELGDLNNSTLTYSFAVEELLDLKFQLLFPTWNEIDHAFIKDADPESLTAINVVLNNKRWSVTFDISTTAETKSLVFEAFILAKQDISAVEVAATAQFNDPVQLKSIFALYQKKIKEIIKVLEEAKDILHANRNLCEDFLPLKTVCTQDIAFCADIEVRPDADIEKVYAQLLFELENYLNPEIRFYTLKEMLNQGVPSQEIFEGPTLTHGFIKTDELRTTGIRSKIVVSDIINFMMDIEGVLSVKNVMLTKYDADGKPILPSERCCLKVDDLCKPLLNIFRSKVLFFKGKLPFKTRLDETMDTLKYLHALESRNKLKGTADDFEMPTGEYRNLDDYVSVEHEFPMVYAVGNNELPESASTARKGQIRQLKAYLKFYDQMLANYFSQLAHAKDLFSFNADVKQTYFGNYVNGVKDVESIYADPTLLQEIFSKPDPADTEEMVQGRSRLLEKQQVYHDRRNRFLDHLIARFAESFNEYVLMLYTYQNADEYEEIDVDKLLQDKITFLKDYPVISKERGQAFDYLAPAWDTDNVSGYEKRLARLSGINEFTRRYLFCLKYIEIQKTGDTISKLFFRIKDEKGDAVLESVKNYDTLAEIEAVIEKLQPLLDKPSAYKPTTIGAGQFSFTVNGAGNKILAKSALLFPDEATRNDAIAALAAKMGEDCPGEGIHLVEHLLLRPRFAAPVIAGEEPENVYKLFQVCLGDDCSFCGEEDPYSFRMSLVLPYWHERFQSTEFRKYFENMARSEAPAHCMVKICWVSNTLMNAFETAYKKWMEALAAYESGLILKESKREKLRLASNKMIEILTEIHSEYPEARLHDCDTGTTNPVLLDNTILGTFTKSDSDE